MATKRDIEVEKERLERLFHEASQRVTLLERERAGLVAENERLKERTRLVERVREELSVVNEKLELLTRLTKEINSLNPDKIFETSVTKIPFILNARFASIYIYDEASKTLYLKRHTHGRPIDRVVEIETETGSIMGRVVASAKVRVFSDLDDRTPETIVDADGSPDAAPPEASEAGEEGEHEYGRGREEEGVAPPVPTPTPTPVPKGEAARPHRELYQTRSCIVAPLRAAGRVLGVLNLADRADGRAFSEEHDLPLVEQIAEILAISLRNLQLFEKVQRQAKMDSLTRLLNHQAFFDELGREVVRAERYGARIAVVMMDIDRFKVINDNHGHLAGDFVLEEVSRAIRSTVRNVDVAARYGGDEFAVVLPESDVKGAVILADRLRARVAQQRFEFGGLDLSVRMSFGVAMHRKGESPTEVVKAADEALYRAKREGGDRVSTRE